MLTFSISLHSVAQAFFVWHESASKAFLKWLWVIKLRIFKLANWQIKVVFFDLGDTLVHLKREVYERWAKEILLLYGNLYVDRDQLEATILSLKEAIRQEWASRVNEDFSWVQSDASEHIYWQHFYSSILVRMNVSLECAELVELMARQAADPDSFACFSHVWETLHDLLSRGIELGIISNAFPSAEKILWQLHLLPAFQYVIFSFERPRGCRKPYVKPFPEIYHHALHCAQAKPQQALLVDDRAFFVEGACEAGLHAVLIDRTGSLPGYKNKIQDLSELRDLSIISDVAVKPLNSYTSYAWPETCAVTQ